MQTQRQTTGEVAELAAIGRVWLMLAKFRRRSNGEDVGPAIKLAYHELLALAGPEVWRHDGGSVEITREALGAALGASGRAAYKWVEELIELNLVQLRDNQNGCLLLWVNTPDAAAGPRVLHPNPQRDLAFAGAVESEQEEAQTPAIRAIAIGEGSDLCAHKGPTPYQGNNNARAQIKVQRIQRSNNFDTSIERGGPFDAQRSEGAGSLSATIGQILQSPAGLGTHAELAERIFSWFGHLAGYTRAHANKSAELLLRVGATQQQLAGVRKRFGDRIGNSKLNPIANAGGYWQTCLMAMVLRLDPSATWPADAPPGGR